MNTHTALIEWCRQQRLESLRQIDLFGEKGVRAFLRMPDGMTQDITSGVVTHQTRNIEMFERLAAALSSDPVA
jgi:hypothetical protein